LCGASTISLVRVNLKDDGLLNITQVISLVSNGNPKDTLDKALSEVSVALPAVVTGRKFRHRVNLTSISESEATEYALQLYVKSNTAFAAFGKPWC
jgi:hypothetical protein